MSEAVWTLGFELDVQSTYERLDQWEEGTGETFYAHVLKTIEVLRRNPFLGRIAFANRVHRILVYNRNYGMFLFSVRRNLSGPRAHRSLASACNRRPSAPTTLRTVSKSGLRSPERAL